MHANDFRPADEPMLGLWLVILFLALNWLGDSLDGTPARGSEAAAALRMLVAAGALRDARRQTIPAADVGRAIGVARMA